MSPYDLRASLAGMVAPPGDVTAVLARWYQGQSSALDELMPLVYRELRLLARRTLLRGPRADTVEPTVLVHELYEYLVAKPQGPFESRSHFFALVSAKMRELLISHCRARRAVKRGGGAVTIQVDDDVVSRRGTGLRPDDLIGMHAALERLDRIHVRQRLVAELRYFGGLTLEETATALAVSPAQVKRDWKTARQWLAEQLGDRALG